MPDFQVISHVQGEKFTVQVREVSGTYTVDAGTDDETARNLNEAVAAALERVRRYFVRHLDRPEEKKWGVRIVTPCGTFQFGDWTFDPLPGAGGGFPQNEGILAVFHEWQERAGRSPAAALSGAAALIRYCLGR